MDPIYRNMHSYPYPRDQTHYGPHFYPGIEPIPTQMHTNHTRPPVNYGCCPWGSTYGYVPPVPCHHGYCNHNPTYMPAHYPWGSPYSHHFPPPHCVGNYNTFPAQYVPTPSPCYPMEQPPRYEYEKNVPSGVRHCCGCLNNPSNERRNVRIEEEEPDAERRKNDSLAPLQFKNAPYPIVWMPHDYGNKKEQVKDDNNNDNRGLWKDGKNNGWYPLDLSNLVQSKQTRNEERKQGQPDDDGDGKGCFPFPLFWIPYKPEENENEMEKHKLNDSDERPSLALEKGSRSAKNFHLIGEDMGGQAAPKAKDIPVKEIEKHEENESFKKQEKEKDAHVKDKVDRGEKLDDGESKLTKESDKGKSPSLPKSSKLPPVCLRVDPLPRRKASNGSSRSPSPPGDKQKQEASKVLNSSDDKKLENQTSNEIKQGKGTKSVVVVDGHAKNMDVKSHDDFSTNQPEEKPKEKENKSRDIIETGIDVKDQSEKDESANGKNEEIYRGKEGRSDEAKETSKRKLSEDEAAVTIQSAYRGFDTRRWEPVMKLKQIAKVREQIDDVKRMIREMESSSDIHGSSKQRNVISETIMSLLLKLDTIQGLHPSIREVRKSVVKELVSLQEKLDAVMNEKSSNSCKQQPILRKKDGGLDKNVGFGSETPSDLPEMDENQPDGAFDCGKSEISEAHANREELMGKVETESDGCVQNEDEKSNEVLEKDEISTPKGDHEDLMQEDIVLEQSSEFPSSCDSSVKTMDFAAPDSDELASELAELPQGVFDDLDAQESTDQKTIDVDTNKTCQVNHTEMEMDNYATGEENNQIHDVFDNSHSEINVQSFDNALGEVNVESSGNSLGEVNVKSDEVVLAREDKIEPKECVDQQPQYVIDDIVELFEASDDREEEFLTANDLKTGSGASDANGSLMSEQAIEYPPLEQQDMMKEKNVAENKSENDTTDYNNVENLEDSKGEDDLTESNRKLAEENERLRGIMEDLVRSGQEQLTAISSLTGRVKDLERKLTKKKKLKVKQRKSNKMRSRVLPEDE